MNAVLLACLLLTLPVQSSDSPPLPGQPSVSFTRDVYPILSRNCLQCHGPQQQNGDFRIDSRDSLLHPDILRPRSPQASELLRRITLPSTDEQHMPPIGNPLTQPQQQLIRQWIDAGAPSPIPSSRRHTGPGHLQCALNFRRKSRTHRLMHSSGKRLTVTSCSPLLRPTPPFSCDDCIWH